MPVRKRVKRIPKVHAAASTYIDPVGCSSTVSYKIVSNRYLYGEVQLADCSRKIDWFFSDNERSLSKIDKAIEALQEFRDAFATARKAKVRRPRKAK